MASSVLICRNCGVRTGADLAVNEHELANVGMLERHCAGCARETTWGLAEDYRHHERRLSERRRSQRRTAQLGPPAAGERRRGRDRRLGAVRKAQRRRG